jgi:hypothetical protein
MYVNTYVLEKLVEAWLAERRADAARIAAIESAAGRSQEISEAETVKPVRTLRWFQLQLGR